MKQSEMLNQQQQLTQPESQEELIQIQVPQQAVQTLEFIQTEDGGFTAITDGGQLGAGQVFSVVAVAPS